SLPSPTLSPGFSRVPRCRTRMEPPDTSCPSNRLTPSRCALESRPLRELPNPFLCAIFPLGAPVEPCSDASFGPGADLRLKTLLQSAQGLGKIMSPAPAL